MKPANKQRYALRAVALGAAMCAIAAGHAAEIVTDNPDLSVRFDNTIKYNYANRISDQNAAILKSVNNDDGDRNFNKGTVSNRLDLLSEFDVVWQNRMGFRISGAAWDDAAYNHLDNTNVASSNHLGADGKPAIGLSDYASRYQKGPSGEILDAFVFGRFELGDMPVNVKLGQHTLYWGESVLSPIHGVNYGQSALDLIKGYSVPGSDAKELFLPRPAISAQFSPTSELSIAAQSFFSWKPARLPESGSFLGFYDYGFQGAESFNLSGLGLPSAMFGQSNPMVAANAQKAAAAVLAAGGTAAAATAAGQQAGAATAVAVGNATCKAAILGSAVVSNNCLFYPVALGGTSQYQLEYASNINVLGLSLSKSIAGISVGADLSYRQDMPLNSTPALLMPVGTNPALVSSLTTLLKGQLVATAANTPTPGEVSGARGNTVHGVLNFIGSTAKTPLFDTSSWIAEFTWNRLASVTQGAQFFKGRDSYTGIDKVSKDFFGLALNFTPTWFQVLPGMDMSMPLNYNVGLSGNSAVLSGGNKNAGNYSAGIGFDLYQKYRVDLKYTDFFGALAVDPTTGAVTSSAGLMPLLKDRGFVSLTFKTTF